MVIQFTVARMRKAAVALGPRGIPMVTLRIHFVSVGRFHSSKFTYIYATKRYIDEMVFSLLFLPLAPIAGSSNCNVKRHLVAVQLAYLGRPKGRSYIPKKNFT